MVIGILTLVIVTCIQTLVLGTATLVIRALTLAVGIKT